MFSSDFYAHLNKKNIFIEKAKKIMKLNEEMKKKDEFLNCRNVS